MAGATRGSDYAAQAVGALVGVAAWAVCRFHGPDASADDLRARRDCALRTQTVGSAPGFEIGQNIAFIRRNLLNYVLAIVLYFIGSFLAQFGVILCCIGVFPVSSGRSASSAGAWARPPVSTPFPSALPDGRRSSRPHPTFPSGPAATSYDRRG